MDEGDLVYGFDQECDNIDASSEPVQGLATSVYKEFERLIAKYDQDVVRDLMPLVVTILETLDQAITEKNESAVEIELMEDDKKQLKSQFERERLSKRQAEQRLIESDDAVESLARELRDANEKFEVSSRQYDMKCKSHIDQMERLLEREAELKKEYNELHQRHSEMIRSYVEHMEKTKALQQQHTPEVTVCSPLVRRKRPDILQSISPLSPQTPSFEQLNSTPVQDSFDELNSDTPKGPESARSIALFLPNLKQEISDAKNKDNDGRGESAIYSAKEDIHPDAFSDRTSVESGSSGPDSGHLLTHEFQQNLLKLGCPVESVTPNYQSDDEPTFTKSESSEKKYGVENEAFEHAIITNNTSLFAELEGKDLDDVDDGADIFGMGKELENLMLENTKLMATKNALDIVKDDLIHQVDQLTNQLTMLQEDLDRAHHAKESLSRRAVELETQLRNVEKKVKETDVASPSSQTSKTPDEDDAVPMSQRKRFTRVEMARVLMERNQYKERLMELQEAVRWTEMLRASRDHPTEEEQIARSKTKNRSSISTFFSRLFGPNSSTPPTNVSPMRRRRRNTQQGEDIMMRHSKSDSFTSGQSGSSK